MAQSLRRMADDLAECLSETSLTEDSLTAAEVLDALASLGLTLVEDPVGDSSITYFEVLSEHRQDSGRD